MKKYHYINPASRKEDASGVRQYVYKYDVRFHLPDETIAHRVSNEMDARSAQTEVDYQIKTNNIINL